MEETFRVMFKTPDAVHYAIDELPEEKRLDASELLRSFLRNGESVMIEFHLEKKTATVVPVSSW